MPNKINTSEPKTPSKPFSFRDEKQEKIYKSLHQFLGLAPATFYKDACKILHETSGIETKTNLVGHLLREIMGWIQESMLPIEYVEKKPLDWIKKLLQHLEDQFPEFKFDAQIKDGTHRQKIAKIAERYGIDPTDNNLEFWRSMSGKDKENGLQRWTHRKTMDGFRKADNDFTEFWIKIQDLIGFLLEKIERNFTHYTKQLDVYFLKPKLTTKEIQKIKAHIPLNQVTLTYFFDNLKDLKALPILHKEGFFDNPRPPIIHDDGSVRDLIWPQMAFLARAALDPTLHKKILQICNEIETDNSAIYLQLLDVAQKLPAKMAAEISKKVRLWLTSNNSHLYSDDYGKLFAYLVENDENEEALALANVLLQIQSDPRETKEIDGYKFPYDPVTRMDEWDYKKILQDFYPKFVDKIGSEALDLLFSKIQEYIKLSDADRASDTSKDDYSEIWRPAIESNSENHNHGIRDLLITETRNLTEHYLKKNPAKVAILIDDLRKRRLNIFDRFALHLMRIFPNSITDVITDSLLNTSEYGTTNRLTHEYYLLAETHSELLSESQREEIWNWISTKADTKSYISWKKKNHGRTPPQEEVLLYENNWKLYHLLPFRKLGGKWEKLAKELITKVGEPDHPSHSSWMQSGDYKYTSILSNEQMSKMPLEELAEYLKTWKPDPNDPLDRSREGTSQIITKLASEDPEKWTAALNSFLDLHPSYMRSLLQGFRDAKKNGKKFDWTPVLEVADKILAKPLEIDQKLKSSRYFGEDPDWSWTRRSIADLVSEGLDNSDNEIPQELRTKVWSILEKILWDSDPDEERDKKNLEKDHDPLTTAINSTRGIAFQAAIEYGIWLKQNQTAAKQKTWTLHSEAPELERSLTDHLDLTKESSTAIRSLYGQQLHRLVWLDKSWIISQRDVIFPETVKEKPYFDAAWEAYISFTSHFPDLFQIFDKQYRRAIRELSQHSSSRHQIESPDQRLADFMALAYWYGKQKIDGKSLVSDFYQYAPPEIKAEAMEFISRRVDKSDRPPSENENQRLRDLVESRVKSVESSDNPQKAVIEFQGFGWWFISESIDPKWGLGILERILVHGCELDDDYDVIEKLAVLADRFPNEAIKCATLIVKNEKREWGISHFSSELQEVITNVLSSQDKVAIQDANTLISIMVANGYINFSKLKAKKLS